MERKYSSDKEALAVAKEAIWLAYQACGGTSGYGFLQARDNATKESVWDNAYNMGDYTGRHRGPEGRVHADYVFGRMMKLSIDFRGDTLTFSDSKPRGDYQSWCHRYPTYAALIDAAETEVIKQAA